MNEAQRLKALIEQGESAAVEFKTTLSDSRKIIETIAAMATIGGGVILVGVRPNGSLVGAEVGEGTLEQFVQRVGAHTDPRIYVDLDRIAVGDSSLLRVRVPPGDGPHLAYGRALYRSGPTTIAMTRDEYERRLLDRLRESSGFERSEITEQTLDDVDSAVVEQFIALAQARGPLPEESYAVLLRRLHVVRSDRLTVAGTLLFSTDPQGPLPQAVIRARSERGASTDSASLEGTLFAQIEAAVSFIARNLRVEVDRTEIVRKERVELPLPAVREAVANAVAHRDYRSTAPIQLVLTDDGLTLWNPGHLPSPITPALLRKEHPSVPTNPLIARVLYLAGYIEEWGTGTLRMIAEMSSAGNPEPLFEAVDSSGIRVTLPLRGATNALLSPRQREFMSGQTPGKPFKTADYATELGIAHRTALQDLQGLETSGLIERQGRGKATYWIKL